MTAAAREPATILSEAAAMLSFRATTTLYDEQPELWRMGERGRARTLEDFGHHFEALSALDASVFSAHVAYCQALFDNHGFPRAWLTDAWRIMAVTVERELPPDIAARALTVLRAGSGVPAQHPRRDSA